ncbi:MFS general substrate transporter [Metschnikowia bicuspidata var. bicuspidata NRRL YB-4993]|uniref:MFS general substrate transporter n=1 Tax=Metschnikowia bicuspidata var. bicuspidata NRRL YB-4993 TaxID=869754 RepID=A0A1A0HEN8_9ASCO|nr:MFS general substrate transporter [Metschnikowia bicuspidata var. bicuspidata NRRL YB-4993]OBA22466.1 MFS general substrate transporter [Metschnikowia bicuspidata var. bicuspidata NRRL YB-4993]
MARLGIRQPDEEIVTGTTVMIDAAVAPNPAPSDGISTPEKTQPPPAGAPGPPGNLKKNAGGIILHPQPMDDPNDPLNWPTLRKDLCFLIIGFQTFLGGGQTPILAAGFNDLLAEFGRPLTSISYLVGAFMLALGFGSLFASPTAILYGKRLVYLVGIVVFLVGSIVCAASANYGGLMAGRILTGFGSSPTESLASASLSEMYFQHERAYRTGLYTLLLLGGKNILPLLSSLIFQHLDRHWLFWIQLMFLALILILTFLFVPETYWDRTSVPDHIPVMDSTSLRRLADENTYTNSALAGSASMDSQAGAAGHQALAADPKIRPSNPPAALAGGSASPRTFVNEQAGQTAPPQSFTHRLHLVSGRHSADKWWMVALRPMFLYAYPAVLYGSLVYSLAVVWLIVISEVLTEIFQAEEYGYSAQTVGLFYISPFVGGILGSLCAGILGDKITRAMVRRNHGIYEPEFRLIMLVPSTLFTCIGLMGFGWSAYVTDPWIAPVIFFGCLSFGSSMASTTAITFTIDCYKMFAAEALVSFNFAKNIIGFVFSLFNNHAYASLEGKDLFVIYGCAQLFLSLLGVLIYVFGKVWRSWTDDLNLLRCLYHKDELVSALVSNADRSLRLKPR